MGSPSRAGAKGTIRTVPATSATINQWAGGFAGVLEQVCGLGVDFKGFGVIEQFQVEQLRHPGIVLQTDAKEYGNLAKRPHIQSVGARGVAQTSHRVVKTVGKRTFSAL